MAARGREAAQARKRAAALDLELATARCGASDAQAEAEGLRRLVGDAQGALADERRAWAVERRELDELRAAAQEGAAASSGGNFTEFVALKREIARLRNENAALQRQLGGSQQHSPRLVYPPPAREVGRDAGLLRGAGDAVNAAAAAAVRHAAVPSGGRAPPSAARTPAQRVAAATGVSGGLLRGARAGRPR